MLATLGKIHYDQSITTSCQYLALVIPQVQLTLSNHNEYDLQSIQNYSQLVAEQMIIENLPSKNTSSTHVIASVFLSFIIYFCRWNDNYDVEATFSRRHHTGCYRAVKQLGTQNFICSISRNYDGTRCISLRISIHKDIFSYSYVKISAIQILGI
jgi:hypothetical protein